MTENGVRVLPNSRFRRPTPLASTTVGGSDGTSCTWGIAMKLGANKALDALECCHLAGHRWAWFAGGARSWRRDFEFHVQNKLAEHEPGLIQLPRLDSQPGRRRTQGQGGRARRCRLLKGSSVAHRPSR